MLAEWFQRCGGVQRPWLILGKGPSFSRRYQHDLRPFFTLALNHAVRELPVTTAHLIDLDVFDACAEAIDRNAQYLLMPIRPHVNNRPSRWRLPYYIRHHPVLSKLDREGRLVGYWLSTGREEPPDGQLLIRVKYFSAEAALRILLTCGARMIRSLGIDGGADYSESFTDLRGTTLLSNHRASFDEQFKEVASMLHETGADYAPLHVETPIRIYVGTTASQELAFQVLAYSIRRHASMTVQVIPMKDLPIPVPQQATKRPRTPFSFSRFLIPQRAGYAGTAIYLDADMQVFHDIARLWTVPFDGADVLYAQQSRAGGRADQFSVLRLNCQSLRWDIQAIVDGLDQDAYSYEDLMHRFCLVPPDRLAARLPSTWNSLEHYVKGTTALLHYTDMQRQPWVSLDNRWGHLWVEELLRAIREGHVAPDTIEREIRLGHVRPSLLAQVRAGAVSPSRQFRALDRGFIGPYRTLLPQATRDSHRPRLIGRALQVFAGW